MKCPKCGFISFDHNEACPKCGNDLTRERDAMGFPPYQPKSLSLLGVLSGAGDMGAAGTADRGAAPSGADGGESDELLISLDTLSHEDHEPARYMPEAPATAPGAPMETETEGVLEELTLSLEDLSDEGPEFVLFDPELEPAVSEPEALDEIVFEPETMPGEESVETSSREGGAAGPEADEGPIGGAPPRDGVFSNEKGLAGKDNPDEPELLELELEPLELDPGMDEPDKKTS
jgi:hypothetical protein